MGELAGLLKQKRERAGNIDFDLPEPEVVLDMEGGVTDILRSERLFSQSIIEECMIAANEAVAHFLEEKGVPSIYRVHEPPEKEKLHDFRRLLQALSIDYGRETGGRMPLQSILHQVEKTDFEFLVNRVLLRSMKQARYSAVNKGHFGLALASYTHFTSPIRRYPDLLIHRILKNTIEGAAPPYRTDDLEKMCSHLSERERIAMEAERELEDRIRVLFMKDRIGEEHEGVISHITSYGFFVELVDVFVEGVVLLSSLHDDYYAFQEEKFRLVGRRTRKVYRIGDHVRVRVVMADPERNRLHFELAPGVLPHR
jgi:ribonuclease R